MLKKLIYILLLLSTISFSAQALSYKKNAKDINFRIIPEYQKISKNSTHINLLSQIDLKNNAHIYWDNPGDTGTPTTLIFFDNIDYTLLSTTKTSPQKEIYDDIITTYIYKDTLYILSEFQLNNLKNAKHISFNATLSYTLCTKNCEPQSLDIAFNIPLAETSIENPLYHEKLMQAEPYFPLKETPEITYNNHHQILTLCFNDNLLKHCPTPYFITNHQKKNPLIDQPLTKKTNEHCLDVTFYETPSTYDGLLLCPNYTYQISKETSTKKNLPLSDTKNNTLWWYILTAFVAGLILNLMPCVLPVLSIKALYLINHQKKQKKTQGLYYLSGVVSSFFLLACIIYIMRLIGINLGWGFQLQSPIFNSILLTLFILIFLSLWDKLPTPNNYIGKIETMIGNNSYLTGFFAVLIACPCTGPFMGSAIGYALTATTAVYFSIFLSLGLGYALPYTLIELYPNIALKYIPKPGPWMQTLKHILSTPIALTIIWLASLIYVQLIPETITKEKDKIWHPYTEENITASLQNNEAVFINFTAKWCLTCQLNDKTIFSTKRFKQYIKDNNIKLYKADWTTKDNLIKQALATYNRHSVPLYIYYKKGSTSPKILPTVLTLDSLINYLN